MPGLPGQHQLLVLDDRLDDKLNLVRRALAQAHKCGNCATTKLQAGSHETVCVCVKRGGEAATCWGGASPSRTTHPSTSHPNAHPNSWTLNDWVAHGQNTPGFSQWKKNSFTKKPREAAWQSASKPWLYYLRHQEDPQITPFPQQAQHQEPTSVGLAKVPSSLTGGLRLLYRKQPASVSHGHMWQLLTSAPGALPGGGTDHTAPLRRASENTVGTD